MDPEYVNNKAPASAGRKNMVRWRRKTYIPNHAIAKSTKIEAVSARNGDKIRKKRFEGCSNPYAISAKNGVPERMSGFHNGNLPCLSSFAKNTLVGVMRLKLSDA